MAHLIAIGYPVADAAEALLPQPRKEGRSFKSSPVAAEAKNQPREEGRSFQATDDDPKFQCKCYCFLCLYLGSVIVFFLSLGLSPLIARLYFPELPSVSLESISFTVVNIASSDTQVTSSLEAVFRIQNNYEHNNITHYHVNALAFHIKKISMGISFMGHVETVEEKKLIANATVAPFEQHGKDDKWLRARMDGVVVDVDDYEQHIHGRYGVSYLEFGLVGFLSVDGGDKRVKPTSSIRATCDEEVRLVFPWDQTTTLGLHPPITCEVYGDWRTLSDRCFYIALSVFFLYFSIFQGIKYFYLDR